MNLVHLEGDMRRLPPLISLRAFEASARHRSFKLAADELGVTPTAVSHQIRALELHCGKQLFRRHPRPITLTAEGAALFPVLRDGFARFSDALAELNPAALLLKVTTTSAFAARWLLPKLPAWRASHPDISLDIISTYDVLDLASGEADIAIRYARNPPQDGHATELFRDTFYVVGSPALVGNAPGHLSPAEIAAFPLIETGWPPADPEAPTWKRWEQEVSTTIHDGKGFKARPTFRFEEELHAIDSAIAGQGLAICSDILASGELTKATLIAVSDVTLPGFGFYLVHKAPRLKQDAISAFTKWATRMAAGSD
jgi:LysR family glycine cleavage system transcriptional activator